MSHVHFLLASFLLVLLPATAPAAESLESSWSTPPAEARPWVYWFWMNGNITREGITADLQAMQRAGIGGVLIMHVGAGIPAGPVSFFSNSWRDLFRYAVSEAERLGLEVGMNACDGWTGTGGPWIKPEEAMLKLVWTETYLEGPAQAAVTLAQPETNLDVYREVAVLALPVPPAEAAAAPAPIVTSSDPKCRVENLADGDPQTVATVEPAQGLPWLQFEFAEPFIARGIQFSALAPNTLPASAKLQVSHDGRAFRTAREISGGWKQNQASFTVTFDDTPARFFRVVLPAQRTAFRELRLLGEGRVHAWEIKAGFARRWGHGADADAFRMRQTGADLQAALNAPAWAGDAARFAVGRDTVLDISSRMDAAGKLDWQVPAGRWVILRIGSTPTGEKNGPASVEGTGLEPDALDPSGVEAAFSRFLARLLDDVGPLAGKTLRYGHIDSWETGEQNWTAAFREEFRRRRGYDMTPLLPVMAGGRIVDSLDVSERFLWDVRRTIADLLADYYYGRMGALCRENGLRFETEAAGAQQFLYDPITYQQQADLPMGEFWVTEGRIRPDCKAAASVAHLFGKRFVGAEAFTCGPAQARWTQHPSSLKVLGDEAFCTGVNRFVFHRYAMQPWRDLRPGMTMGPWGIHFERTNTWWEPGSAWLEYLARCQSLLQQGRFVADVLYLTGEGAPNYLGSRDELTPGLPPGYDFDACNPQVLLEMTSVREGRLVVQGGQQYRLLLLPNERTMSSRLLQKIQELVEQGAVVVGPRPEHAPGLTDYPHCDQQIHEMADILWGAPDAGGPWDRTVGRGRVFWGLSFEEIFERIGLPADFAASSSDEAGLRYIHRQDDQADWYFVSNPSDSPVETICTFRVSGRRPERWDPETGRMAPLAVYRQEGERTILPLRLEPAESVFVVFRQADRGDSILAVRRDGAPLLSTEPATSAAVPNATPATRHQPDSPPQASYPAVRGSFSISFWVRPTAPIELPAPSAQGITGARGQRFVVVPDQGELAYGEGHASAGVSVGTNGVCVFEHSARYFPARIVHQAAIDDWLHVAVVYEDNLPRLYLDGRLVASAPRSSHIVHPGTKRQTGVGAPGQIRTLQISVGRLTLEQITALADRTRLITTAAWPTIQVVQDGQRVVTLLAWEPGTYTFQHSDAVSTQLTIDALPDAVQVDGPWQVHFPPGAGAPETVTFDTLTSWAADPRPGIKYFSGTAAYKNTIVVPDACLAADRRLVLDLGRVEVMAEVRIGGESLGILWKPPFRVDVSDVLKPGENSLEIRVTNLWPNRLIGDEQFPADSSFGPKGNIAQWPAWLPNIQQRPEPGRLTFSSWKHYEKNSPLLPAGLLGPVQIRAAATRKIVLPEPPPASGRASAPR